MSFCTYRHDSTSVARKVAYKRFPTMALRDACGYHRTRGLFATSAQLHHIALALEIPSCLETLLGTIFQRYLLSFLSFLIRICGENKPAFKNPHIHKSRVHRQGSRELYRYPKRMYVAKTGDKAIELGTEVCRIVFGIRLRLGSTTQDHCVADILSSIVMHVRRGGGSQCPHFQWYCMSLDTS